MNILITGRAIEHQPGLCTGQQLARGFEELGHNVIFYGNVYEQPDAWFGTNELRDLGGNIDVAIVTECNDGLPQLDGILLHYKVKDSKKLLWDFDISFHPERNLEYARKVEPDAFLVANNEWVLGFNNLGRPSFFMPYAFSSWHHRPLDITPEYLVGFIGSMTPERQPLVDRLERSGIRTNVKSGVFGEDLVQETNKLYLMFHKNQAGCKGLIPGRPFETMGCGVPLLLCREDADDWEDSFPVEHCLVYENENHLVDLVLQYKSQTGELIELGKKLHQVGLWRHTYKRRAEQILEIADGI